MKPVSSTSAVIPVARATQVTSSTEKTATTTTQDTVTLSAEARKILDGPQALPPASEEDYLTAEALPPASEEDYLDAKALPPASEAAYLALGRFRS